MRDYRDAKSMAHMLREELASGKNYKITVGESLELIAHLFGAADWNTLSALIKNSDQDPNPPGAVGRGTGPRFAPTMEATLLRSIRAADERGQTESTVEHLLLSLTEDSDAAAIMKARGIDPAAIREVLARSIEITGAGDSRNRAIDPTPSPAFQRVVQRAILDAQASGELTITGAHLFVAILSVQDATAARILREHGLDHRAAPTIAGRRKS
jgi:hypothetical protein